MEEDTPVTLTGPIQFMAVASKPVQAREALWLELLIMEVDKAEATISTRVYVNASCRGHLECCTILAQAGVHVQEKDPVGRGVDAGRSNARRPAK